MTINTNDVSSLIDRLDMSLAQIDTALNLLREIDDGNIDEPNSGHGFHTYKTMAISFGTEGLRDSLRVTKELKEATSVVVHER